MATASLRSRGGNSTDSQKVLCRYYMNGACHVGSSCPFSHNMSDRPSNICRYYLRGKCSYGSGCRYDHVRQNPRTSSNSSSSAGSVGRSRATASKPAPPAQSSSNHNAKVNTVGDAVSGSTAGPSHGSQPEPDCAINISHPSRLRVDAPEFVPGQPFMLTDKKPLPANYAQAVSGNAANPSDMAGSSGLGLHQNNPQLKAGKQLICPYYVMGSCCYGEMCAFAHGAPCDLCNRNVLHPTDYQQNIKHKKECVAEHEKDMEEAFALARSCDKVCGICMEVILEKKDTSARRFGVLQNCKHTFCLECIRKWRQSRNFENKIVRACPECRTVSDFVTPSLVWVEDEPEKSKLIGDYKKAMGEKNCRYFRQGASECPFGNQCFYRHAKPDGTVVHGDSPRTVRRRMNAQHRRRHRSDSLADRLSGEILREYLLWQFLEDRDDRHRADDSIGSSERGWIFELALEDELDFLSLASDSEDSDFEVWELLN